MITLPFQLGPVLSDPVEMQRLYDVYNVDQQLLAHYLGFHQHGIWGDDFLPWTTGTNLEGLLHEIGVTSRFTLESPDNTPAVLQIETHFHHQADGQPTTTIQLLDQETNRRRDQLMHDLYGI